MPDDQDRQGPKGPKERPVAGAPSANDPVRASDQASAQTAPLIPSTQTPTTQTPATQSAPRRRTPSDRTDPRQPVDFRAAAQRLTARAAQIARLKTEVEQGAYQADPTETARAMERRSDA